MIYLEAQQDAEIPRRPVVDGINQVDILVHTLLFLVTRLSGDHCQFWTLIVVFILEEGEERQTGKRGILSIFIKEDI